MSRWDQVRVWRDRLRSADLSSVASPLSPQGLAAALHASLDSLDDAALYAIAAIPGQPFGEAVVITAGTVPTAALEWLAALLGRGSRVTWKHPTDQPGLAPLATSLASELPLSATSDRDCIDRAELIVVMGSDQTVAEVRAQARPGTTVYGHGHAWSCAWVTDQELPSDPRIPQGFASPWRRLAADAALYDGRGCLSPSVVFTPLPLDRALDALAEAMEAAQARWPRGAIHPAEAALERQHRARTKVLGQLRTSPGWSLHGLEPAHLSPHSLPRSLAIVSVPALSDAVACASRWGRALSTVGTDDPRAAQPWLQAGATRICPIGRMQRPPLNRVHDGVYWISQTFRATGTEV